MTLLEILVRELPRRGGWPGDAVAISVSSNMAVYAHERMPNRIISGVWTDDNEDTFGKYGRVFLLDESPDYREKPVTREQYEAALAAKNDGWIDWGGGECPVGASEMVDVIFGHGGRMPTNIADCWRWNHSGTSSDIIAYRLHKPVGQQIPTEETSIWNGEGLPPVGCDCEYQDSNTNEWYPVTIQYVSDQLIVICGVTNILGEEQKTEIAKDIICDKPQFRPICSEADKKREVGVLSLSKAGGADPFSYGEKLSDGELIGSAWYVLYDKIAAGEVDGIRID